MALVKHRVLEAEIDEYGNIHIPNKCMVIGVNFRFPSGKPYLVLVMKYEDWAEEFPEEAEEERKTEDAAAHQEEVASV